MMGHAKKAAVKSVDSKGYQQDFVYSPSLHPYRVVHTCFSTNNLAHLVLKKETL